MNPRYSIIVPVYNRPDEVNELLESLAHHVNNNFEVIIVEDGSTVSCKNICDKYLSRLRISYFAKRNEGPGPARNFGYQQAKGDYFISFDSDCVIPAGYFDAVDEALQKYHYDAWGGPDRAHQQFTLIQRAMGYTMSSILTTGGIRGGKKRVGWFQPRSFNMGISRKVFEKTGGFAFSRFAEDIEFSIRIKKAGFNVGLIESAFVYHKRRTTFRQFFNQVFNFGKGRALVGSAHPGEVKLTHWFPTAFMFGVIMLCLLPIVSFTLFKTGVFFFSLYLLSIFFHSLATSKSLAVAALSVPSAFLQLTGYGLGFLVQQLRSRVTKSV